MLFNLKHTVKTKQTSLIILIYNIVYIITARFIERLKKSSSLQTKTSFFTDITQHLLRLVQEQMMKENLFSCFLALAGVL